MSTSLSYFDPNNILVPLWSTLVDFGGLCTCCVPNGNIPPNGWNVGGRWSFLSSKLIVDLPDWNYANIGGIGGVGGKFGGRQVVSSSCSTMYKRSRGPEL